MSGGSSVEEAMVAFKRVVGQMVDVSEVIATPEARTEVPRPRVELTNAGVDLH